jgi:drug/metabolite transporter (DMT)-like permease
LFHRYSFRVHAWKTALEKQKDAVWVGVVFTLLSAVLWGGTYPVIQIALRYYDPFVISFFRAIFGTLTILVYYLLLRNKGQTRPKTPLMPRGARTWSLLILASIFGAGGFWILLNLSVLYLRADTASFLAALYPLIVFILASVFLKEKMRSAQAIGVISGIIGAYVIVSFGEKANLSGADPLLGVMIALSTSFFFAAYILTSRVLTNRKYDASSDKIISPEFVTLMTFLLAILPTFVAVVLTGSSSQLLQRSLEGFLLILYLGVAASGIAFLLFNMGLKIIGAGRAAINQLLFPAVAVILSYIFLGLTVNAADVVGIVLILGGIVVSQRFMSQDAR